MFHHHQQQQQMMMADGGVQYDGTIQMPSSTPIPIDEVNAMMVPEDTEVKLRIANRKLFASGSFGKVFKATLLLDQPNDVKVAIKQVLHDNRYHHRELPTMKQLSHQNVVKLLYYFKSKIRDSDENVGDSF